VAGGRPGYQVANDDHRGTTVRTLLIILIVLAIIALVMFILGRRRV
jgi:Tfp pilus assembly protein PilX